MLSIATVFPSAFQTPALARPVNHHASSVRMQAEAIPAEPEVPPPFDPVAYAKTLPGITDPLGFFE